MSRSGATDQHAGRSEASDVCADCGRVFPAAELFRCGRTLNDGDRVVIQLCIDCLYAVNPHMQRKLIGAAFDAKS